MKKGIIYVRVSSVDQTLGTSLDNQERACLEYAEKNGIEIVQTFIEKGESATAATRTEFLKALFFCHQHRKEVTAFIVWKIDRFARNTTDHFAVRAKLTNDGIILHSVTEPITQDHIGKLTETFLAGYAEFENEVRKQRCVGGMQARLHEGIWCWSPPIGYTNSKRLKDRRKTLPDVPDENRFSLIQRGLRLYMEGNHTITALAKESVKWGLVTRTGRPMRKQLWEVILTDKFYAGILTDPWTGDEYKGLHTPMITREEYERIRRVKNGLSNHATAARLAANPDFPLRQFVQCECGRPFTASWSTGRKKKYPMYFCHNKQCAHFGHSIARGIIETKFHEYLQRITPLAAFLTLFQKAVLVRYKDQHVVTQQEESHHQRELTKLETKRKDLLEMRLAKEISKEEYKEMKDVVDCQIAAINAPEHEITDKFDMETAIANVAEFLRNMADQWQTLESPFKQQLQKAVLPAGITYQKTNGVFRTAIIAPILRLNTRFLSNPSDLVAEVGQSWNQIQQNIKEIYELTIESRAE